jgi:CDGSH-type Zn-finger protein/uncharacterized Fe-S cluster protein YjdI
MEDKSKLKRYHNEKIEVYYSRERCIHYAACVRGLPSVFNTRERPWINVENADPDAVAEVVLRCPTGALHFERLDGGEQESIPEKNTITASRNGPLYVRGNVTILNSQGDVILEDTRVALCRCGASKNKPFCDNSHLDIGFSEPGELHGNAKPPLETHTPLKIQPTLDGPYLLRGDFEIFSADGQSVYRGKSMLLCRCGGSKNKPFCDDTHLENGFKSEV